MARLKPLLVAATTIGAPSVDPLMRSLGEGRPLEALSGDMSIVGTIEAHSCVLLAAVVAAGRTNIAAFEAAVLVEARADRPCRTAVAGSCQDTSVSYTSASAMASPAVKESASRDVASRRLRKRRTCWNRTTGSRPKMH